MIMYRLDFSTCTSFTITWFFYTDTLISFVYINNCFSKILINMFRFSFSFQHYLYVPFCSVCFSGNNRLGGQDFNLRLYNYVKDLLETKFNLQITDKEDLQALRLAVEQVKINVTHHDSSTLKLFLHSLGKHSHIKETITRAKFEELNKDLFVKVLDPIRTVLKATHLEKEDIDEIVLVGGSTRIPMIRNLIREFFGKELNTHVDPELAVAMGVSIQAGIIGGMWPLKVSAVELPNRVVKIQVQ